MKYNLVNSSRLSQVDPRSLYLPIQEIEFAIKRRQNAVLTRKCWDKLIPESPPAARIPEQFHFTTIGI